MNQNDYRIADHLPESLNRDNMRELAETIDAKMAEINQMSELVSIYPRIDELSSNLIDALAIQFHVDYYSTSLPLDMRRALVKNSIRWHTRKGTRAALDEILQVVYGNCKVQEWYEYNDKPYYFMLNVKGSAISDRQIKDILAATNAMKNERSWLRGIVWRPEVELYTNRAGDVKTRNIPDAVIKQKRKYVIFEYGTNQAGPLEIISKTNTITNTERNKLFIGGTLNGRLYLNDAGEKGLSQRDIGYEKAEKWYTFSGSRLNDKNAKKVLLNNAQKIKNFRTTHVADFETIETFHGKNTNSAEVKIVTKTSSAVTQTAYKRFSMDKCRYTTNRAGNYTVIRKDIGNDIVVKIHIFDGCNTNYANPVIVKEKNTTKKTSQYTVFIGTTANSKKNPILNDAKSEKRTNIIKNTQETKRMLFVAPLLNGTLRTNNAKNHIKEMKVHVEKWRNVIVYYNAALTNQAEHTEKEVEEITGVIKGRVERYFTSPKGTLLNSKARAGYLKLYETNKEEKQ